MEPTLAAFWANIVVTAMGVFCQESRMRIPDINLRVEGGVAGDQATAAVLVNSIQPVIEAKPVDGQGFAFLI
jgi:hypothetical protein